MNPEDPWSRVDYRRLIAWPQRIEREWPFLSARLESAPSRRVLDLGCGTGGHRRHPASPGYRVGGSDPPPAPRARQGDGGPGRGAPPAPPAGAGGEPLPPNLHFIEGDIADVASLVDVPA